MFNDLSIHLKKLKKCFETCQEYGISFNLNKCAFMIFFGMILGFIVFNEGKFPSPKNIQAFINMHVPNRYKISMV
jgi:hypothetical protein